jgi:hypothetical protein
MKEAQQRGIITRLEPSHPETPKRRVTLNAVNPEKIGMGWSEEQNIGLGRYFAALNRPQHLGYTGNLWPSIPQTPKRRVTLNTDAAFGCKRYENERLRAFFIQKSTRNWLSVV